MHSPCDLLKGLCSPSLKGAGMNKPFCGFIFSLRNQKGARGAGGHMGYTGQHRQGGAQLLQVTAGPNAAWSEGLGDRPGEGGHFASCKVTAASLRLGCRLPANTQQKIPHHAWLSGTDSSSRRGHGARCRHLPVHRLRGVPGSAADVF